MLGHSTHEFPSPVREGRPPLSSLTGLGTFPNRVPSTKVLGYFHGGNKAEAIIMGTNGWAIFRGKPQPFAERMIDDSSRLNMAVENSPAL